MMHTPTIDLPSPAANGRQQPAPTSGLASGVGNGSARTSFRGGPGSQGSYSLAGSGVGSQGRGNTGVPTGTGTGTGSTGGHGAGGYGAGGNANKMDIKVLTRGAGGGGGDGGMGGIGSGLTNSLASRKTQVDIIADTCCTCLGSGVPGLCFASALVELQSCSGHPHGL